MPRALSGTALASLQAAHTDQVWLLLLELDHSSLSEPIRVVSNTEDITSGGDRYVAYPFEVALPEDAADRVPQVSLKIDNVDQAIMAALRPLLSPPTVTLRVVLADQPDVVELEIGELSLREVDYDLSTITGTLHWENVLNEKYPAGQYLPSTAPGLF